MSGLVGLAPSAAYIMLPVESGDEIDRDSSGGSHTQNDETTSRDGWAAFSGTSAACPQVAGVCALLKQACPRLAPSEIRDILRRTARDVTTGRNAMNQQATTGFDLATGAGLVDAERAVLMAKVRCRAPATDPLRAGLHRAGRAGGRGPGGPGAGRARGRGRGRARDLSHGAGLSDQSPMSAQVVLRPAGGAAVPDAEIRAAEAQRLEPDPEAARACRAWFEQRGFEVSPLTGNSFSISGEAKVFERALGGELSTQRLPEQLRDSVEAITASPRELLR